MDVKSLIETTFDAEITRIFKPKQEIEKFLLNHPRKSICVGNLVHEVKKSDLLNPVRMDRERVLVLSKSYAKTFASAALEFKERETMTQLQKGIEEKKLSEHLEMEKLFEENIQTTDETYTSETK